MKHVLVALISCWIAGAAVAGPALDMVKRAETAAAEGRLEEANGIALRVLHTADEEAVKRAETLLSTVGPACLFSADIASGKTEYRVVANDYLGKIAKKYGVTVGLIQRTNHIKGANIRVGQKLMIPTGTLSLDVDKSDNVMVLKSDGKFVKKYVVATGRNNHTPIGAHTITVKIEKPTWTRPTDKKVIPYGDPENELGTRWMAWSVEGFGIHGTWDNESLGTQASAGCVRMKNEEVEELFSLVPVGTVVTVVD